MGCFVVFDGRNYGAGGGLALSKTMDAVFYRLRRQVVVELKYTKVVFLCTACSLIISEICSFVWFIRPQIFKIV